MDLYCSRLYCFQIQLSKSLDHGGIVLQIVPIRLPPSIVRTIKTIYNLIIPIVHATLENITSLLPSVLLVVCSMGNSAKGNEQVIFFWYSYGDNDFIV